ncbi:hypothetical protein BGZ49_007193 [Haplosporangium sp. Z 27]|nr:hypothetical protein BGZ49_007193 [Haplosporangium sp. Z 27]
MPQRQGQKSMGDGQSQLSIPWFKQTDLRSLRRSSSGAISNNSTTDFEENTSDQDSFHEISSSPSDQSSRTASPGTVTSSGTQLPSSRKGKTSGLRLSLKSLRNPKSQTRAAHDDNVGQEALVEATPRSAIERRLSLDQESFEGRKSFENDDTRRWDPPTSTQLFSSSAPKPASRFSFIYSPAPTSPSTNRPFHQRSNTTPMQSPIPSNYGTSPGRSLASPSPQPVRETHTMKKEYDPMTGNKMINKYMVVRELGRGVHGKVKLCQDTITSEFCAIKIVDKTTRRRLGRSQLSNEQKIRREVAIMKKCIHPHVVRLIEVIDDPNARKIYLVLEFMEGGEVRWKDTEDKPILPLQDARSIFRDVVLGLEYLHTQGIIHRDIKPANLLLSADRSVKISDFGVSHFSEKNILERDLESPPIVSKGFNIPQASNVDGNLHHGSLASPVSSSFSVKAHAINNSNQPELGSPFQMRQPSNTIQHQQWGDDLELAKTAGSPAFFAPELCYASDFSTTLTPVLSTSQTSFIMPTPVHRLSIPNSLSTAGNGTTRPPITKAIDIWALGVTLYCFIYGRCPFTADTEFELFNIIPRRQPDFPDSVAGRDYVDPSLKDLLSRLLEKDVHKRITLKDIKEHPWVTEDLQDPIRWRIETDPSNYQRVHVTEEEVKGAVTIMDKIKNRIRKLSVSIDSPTTEHGPIPIIRSPSSTLPTQPHGSLPERFHNFHLHNGPPTGFGSGRLERPNSVCSNTSSIDEVDEGDEYSGHSGSGSSAQNNISYVGRRRLFQTTGQQQQQQQQQHQQQQLPQQQFSQYQQSHPHPHHQGGYQHRPPSFTGLSGFAGYTMHPISIAPTRRTYSDDQLDQGRVGPLSHATSSSARVLPTGHSGLSKSWVYSPIEVSPLTSALHEQAESLLQDMPQELTPRPLAQSIIAEERTSLPLT